MTHPANAESAGRSSPKRPPSSRQKHAGTKELSKTVNLPSPPDHEWRFASDALRQGVVFVDVNGNIRSGNSSLERALGITDGKLGDTTTNIPRRVIHPDGTPFRYEEQPVIVALRTGRVVTDVEMGVRNDTGQLRWFVSTGQPVRDDDARIIGAVASFVDITELRELQQRERAQHDALAHASRVMAVGDLASLLTHELTQPLMAIEHFNHAAMTLLETGNESCDPAIAMLRNADEQIRRTGEMIRHLRRFVRCGLTDKKQADLMTIVANAVQLLQPLLTNQSIDVRSECFVNLPDVNVDAVQIEQVLLNLIRNGVEAMQRTQEPRVLTIGCANNPDYVEIAIHDNGIGLDPSRAARLFELYETTKADGMGIGLAVSRSIIRAHGGDLRADNSPNGGTTFRFSLPVAAKKKDSS